jgi:sirohydrochlorin cobaltochelatase
LKVGVVLFAHGSRDPEWSRPFERVSTEVARRLPHASVCVAYLELMRPTLAEAVAALGAAGAKSIRVVPVFFGQGGHVREDLPRLVSELRRAHGDLELVLEKPIGEDPAVIEAIAGAIAAGIPSPPGSGPRS